MKISKTVLQSYFGKPASKVAPDVIVIGEPTKDQAKNDNRDISSPLIIESKPQQMSSYDKQTTLFPARIVGQAFWNKQQTEPTRETKAKVLIDYFKNIILPDEELILSPSGLCIEVKAYVKWVFDEMEQDKNKVNYFAYVGKLNELNELLSTVKYND